MSLHGSSIPHLARSIIEKRARTQVWKDLRDGSMRSFTASVAIQASSIPAPRAARQTPTPRPTRPLPTPLNISNQMRDSGKAAGSKYEKEVHQQRRDTAPDMTKKYPGMMIATTIFATFLGGYVMMLYTNWNNEIKKHVLLGKTLTQDADVSDRWKQLGRDYDSEVEWSEKYWFWNRISGRRKELASQAYGKVLEVSAGTGRNLEYYYLHPFDPTDRHHNLISSLTLNDQSSVMIATAEKKYEEFHDQNKRPFTGKVEFTVGDAGIRGIIKRPEGGYDTIVQTMGLCSMVDPVSFLKVMGTLCRQPGEQSKTKDMQIQKDDGKGGRILLLEHGRSRYGLLNRILDSGASMHADHYGCWWNKDIARIIQQSGLEIEKVKRYHWGTTWEIHLRPRRITSDNQVSDQ